MKREFGFSDPVQIGVHQGRPSVKTQYPDQRIEPALADGETACDDKWLTF